MGISEQWTKFRNGLGLKGKHDGETESLLLLPESTGTLAEYEEIRQQLDWAEEFYRKPGVEFESNLPYVIGFVPPEERKFFLEFMKNRKTMRAHPDKDETNELIVGMPETYKIISQDAANIDPTLVFGQWFLDRKNVQAGTAHRPNNQDWHLDNGINYLISDVFPTEFYQGKAKFLDLAELSVDTQKSAVSASPFAIVRQGPQTVHRSPIFTKDMQRTFIAFSYMRLGATLVQAR